jgi:hypothetical protein
LVKAVCRDGLAQSAPTGIPLIAAISGGDLFRGQQASEAWLGALAEFDLDGFDEAGGDGVIESLDVEASGVVAAAEVAGADLEYQVGAVEVVW